MGVIYETLIEIPNDIYHDNVLWWEWYTAQLDAARRAIKERAPDRPTGGITVSLLDAEGDPVAASDIYQPTWLAIRVDDMGG